MSAKQAKATRRVLALHRLPALKTEITISAMPALSPKNRYTEKRKNVVHFFPEKTYTVEADHGRRIRRLAKSEQLTIADAIERYVKKVGMAKKPKANETPTKSV